MAKKAKQPAFAILKKKPIRNVVVVSDLHVGCRLGLCSPDGADLDDGGKYMPSKMQLKIWSYWQEFFGDWVPRVTQGEPFILVANGDLIEGSHHGSTTQFSQNIEDQVDHAEKILKPIVRSCEKYYQIRGTEAHVGKSGRDEEELAKRLGATPNEEGVFSRWDLWLKLSGDWCHFLHHIGGTSSAAHEVSAVNAELSAIYTEAGRWGHEPPKIICRSHRHRCSEIRLPCPGGYATAFVTPAWQAKTPFSWKIAGARNSTPQFGGSIIRRGEEDIYTRHFVKDIGRTEGVVA